MKWCLAEMSQVFFELRKFLKVPFWQKWIFLEVTNIITERDGHSFKDNEKTCQRKNARRRCDRVTEGRHWLEKVRIVAVRIFFLVHNNAERNEVILREKKRIYDRVFKHDNLLQRLRLHVQKRDIGKNTF